MESLRAADAASPAAKAAASKPPLRFGCIYFSNGVEPAHWWAKGNGASMELGPCLQAMAPYREDISFIRGLYNQQAVLSTSPHLGRMPNMLSGATVSLDPADIRVGTTFDQVLAQRIGSQTAVPSLVLGIEPNELRLEDGLSMIYGSCISWAAPTKPATKEIYPARTFDLLVGDGRGLMNTSSRSAALRSGLNALRSRSVSKDGVRRWRSRTCRVRPMRYRRTCRIT
jgi:hypothetical protein